ncbi:MAG: hypothetical protein CL674_14355 [Bdellovibrionaceae bacterium]|jgi:hypothetical protein|nr:hypothetical protein [Pseudobdellovibrionaceae bacterium]MAF92449.1 hypothetical protein [Pseudobdellovibrionaceae bacterium]QDP47592.1 MAG: hypothetical protein GOVbin1174_40 [Prokaryotic dsDNA virus sp.]|tara:strand:+ start:1638 stop:1946 length:309 start_codon:yes stop_codon:yes gene_type:complete
MRKAILSFATFIGVELEDKQITEYSNWVESEINEIEFRKGASKYIKFDLRNRHGAEHISVTLAKIIDYAKPREELERQARILDMTKQLNDYNKKRLARSEDS